MRLQNAHSRFLQNLDTDRYEMVPSTDILIRDSPTTGSDIHSDSEFCSVWINCAFKLLVILDGDAIFVTVFGTQ